MEKSLITDSRASLISSLRPNFFTEKEFVLALDYQSFYLEEKIGFVKIDVEGAEYEVYEQCLGIPQICIEFHSFCLPDKTIKDDLRIISSALRNGAVINGG